jgi:protein-L-isoaspartate O-methyltransferase
MDGKQPRHASSRTGLSKPAYAKATITPPQNQMNQPWVMLAMMTGMALSAEGGVTG